MSMSPLPPSWTNQLLNTRAEAECVSQGAHDACFSEKVPAFYWLNQLVDITREERS